MNPLLKAGTSFSPLSLSPALWLDASDQSTLYQDRTGASATTLVASDADPVGTWRDKSGNARHATAASDAARPTFKTGIKNGRSVVRFDGVNDGLLGGTTQFVQTTSAFSIFIIYKLTGSAMYPTLFSTNTNQAQNFRIIESNQAQYETIGFGSQSGFALGRASGATVRGNYYISNVTYNGSGATTRSNFEIIIDGSSKTLSSVPLGYGLDSTSGFGVGMQSNSTNPMEGDMAELIIYNFSLSTSQRQKVERYLASKWGITLS